MSRKPIPHGTATTTPENRTGYLDESALASFASHTYQTQPYSFVDNLFNNNVWIPLARNLPAYLHPNTITVVAGACMLFGTIFVLAHSDETLQAHPPSWVYFVAVLA
jgi:hypothetical protein